MCYLHDKEAASSGAGGRKKSTREVGLEYWRRRPRKLHGVQQHRPVSGMSVDKSLWLTRSNDGENGASSGAPSGGSRRYRCYPDLAVWGERGDIRIGCRWRKVVVTITGRRRGDRQLNVTPGTAKMERCGLRDGAWSKRLSPMLGGSGQGGADLVIGPDLEDSNEGFEIDRSPVAPLQR